MDVFVLQTVDYSGYSTYDAQSVAQYSSTGYYSTQSYSPYVSSPSSSGSIGTASYQLAATSLPGKFFDISISPPYCLFH